jgi:hypothetical protein
MKEEKGYLLWSPVTFKQLLEKYTTRYPCGNDATAHFIFGKYLAEWNLVWLFCYESLGLYDGTLKGIERVLVAGNEAPYDTRARVGMRMDVEDNTYGIKDLAEVLTPTEFITEYMKRPYQHTLTYELFERDSGYGVGEKVFQAALKNAPLLESRMIGNALIDDEGVPYPAPKSKPKSRKKLVAQTTSNVIPFPVRRK